MSQLRVTIVQAALAWEDASANRAAFAQLLDPSTLQTDLVVLPEMFTTGFSMDAARLAEPANGPTLHWMRQQAIRLGAVICGSYIAEEGGSYFNRLVWMPPEGDWSTYDKRHLFSYAQEDAHYTAGTKRLLVEYHGWRILPLICYDLRFPVWSRNTDDYDLLIYIANFPARRRKAWTSLLTARAIENLSYTVAVNRVGADGNEIGYTGDSGIIDYSGEWIAHFVDAPAVHTVTLEQSAQQQFRRRYGFLADRDRFQFL